MIVSAILVAFLTKRLKLKAIEEELGAGLVIVLLEVCDWLIGR